MRFLAAAAASAALAALAFGLSPAAGQEPGSALKGHDTDAPVDVAADRIEVQDRADRAIFSGNVIVRQAQLQLNAQRLTVAYSSAGGIQIERIDASGGVFLRSPSETARGQYAIYDINERLITLVGGVTLTRGESRVTGGRLVLDLDSGRAVMDGGGPAAPDVPAGTTSTPAGRVTGTFTVPRRNGTGGQ
ncbi:MAG TPA: LptA/OstA family protein [Allosphingosinicella sp.]|jgi:lipopolysaccharide export system protein LptA